MFHDKEDVYYVMFEKVSIALQPFHCSACPHLNSIDSCSLWGHFAVGKPAHAFIGGASTQVDCLPPTLNAFFRSSCRTRPQAGQGGCAWTPTQWPLNW